MTLAGQYGLAPLRMADLAARFPQATLVANEAFVHDDLRFARIADLAGSRRVSVERGNSCRHSQRVARCNKSCNPSYQLGFA
jgi:hypothetical protein